jgi:hypothetical protein
LLQCEGSFVVQNVDAWGSVLTANNEQKVYSNAAKSTLINKCS